VKSKPEVTPDQVREFCSDHGRPSEAYSGVLRQAALAGIVKNVGTSHFIGSSGKSYYRDLRKIIL